MKAKILILTGTSKKQFIKNFKSLDDFYNYKDSRLDNNVNYIKYSLLLDGETKYTLPKKEYSKNRIKEKTKFTISNKYDKNKSQKNSRNNQLALVGNDLINLNMTPIRQRNLVKFMEQKPVTDREKNIIKSMFANDKLSISQYNLIREIQETANRRVRC